MLTKCTLSACVCMARHARHPLWCLVPHRARWNAWYRQSVCGLVPSLPGATALLARRMRHPLCLFGGRMRHPLCLFGAPLRLYPSPCLLLRAGHVRRVAKLLRKQCPVLAAGMHQRGTTRAALCCPPHCGRHPMQSHQGQLLLVARLAGALTLCAMCAHLNGLLPRCVHMLGCLARSPGGGLHPIQLSNHESKGCPSWHALIIARTHSRTHACMHTKTNTRTLIDTVQVRKRRSKTSHFCCQLREGSAALYLGCHPL